MNSPIHSSPEGRHAPRWYGGETALIIRLVLSSLIFAAGMLISMPAAGELALMALSAAIAGYDIAAGAVRVLINRRILGAPVLIVVAVIASFFIGKGYEGACAMLFYRIGGLFLDYAIAHSRDTVEKQIVFRPGDATLSEGKNTRRVAAEGVDAGAVILVRPGEIVPLDAVVLSGRSTIDLSALTGDEGKRHVGKGDSLLAGTRNLENELACAVIARAENSAAARILETVRRGAFQKSRAGKALESFARVYTPIVLLCALWLFVFLPFLSDVAFRDSLYRALTFVVVASPAAILVSIPSVYFAGMGGVSKLGIVFKSSSVLDDISKAKAVVFDKTGTLTTGDIRVSAVKNGHFDPDFFLKVAAHAEAYSSHPIARAINDAYGGTLNFDLIDGFSETSGKGVEVTVETHRIILGSVEFLEENGIRITDAADRSPVAVYMAIDGEYAGRILLSDSVREDAADAVHDLYKAGNEYIALLTGDTPAVTANIAKLTGIREFYSGCRPADKAARVRDIKNRVSKRGTLVFVSDGRGDTSAFTAADVAVALGVSGPDAAGPSGVDIMDPSPVKVASAINSARHTRLIVLENTAFVLAVKLAVLAFSGFGISALWFSVLADALAALLAVFHSTRALKVKTSPLDKFGKLMLAFFIR